MFLVVIGIILIVLGLAVISWRGRPPGAGLAGTAIPGAGIRLAGFLVILAGLGFLTSTSFVFIGADEVGNLKRVYLADDLPPGRILALSGQKGPQAEILGPGFHFRPFLNILYQVETFGVVQVPEGYYGQITTLDGAPMPEGMFIAPIISDDKLATMLNAETFIEQGGYRGPQETC